jgi:hypothetical protein
VLGRPFEPVQMDLGGNSAVFLVISLSGPGRVRKMVLSPGRRLFMASWAHSQEAPVWATF